MAEKKETKAELAERMRKLRALRTPKSPGPHKRGKTHEPSEKYPSKKRSAEIPPEGYPDVIVYGGGSREAERGARARSALDAAAIFIPGRGFAGFGNMDFLSIIK